VSKALTIILLTLFIGCHLSVYGQFKKGQYYTHNGEKVEGLLKYVIGGGNGRKTEGHNYIYFKKYKKIKKKDQIKLTTNEIKSFVIEQDSFAIVKNFSINSTYYQKDFARVLESGRINFYIHNTSMSTHTPNGMMKQTRSVQLIEKNGRVDRLKLKSFKSLMPGYVSDCPELSEKVNSRKLWYDKVRIIIQVYNQHCEK